MTPINLHPNIHVSDQLRKLADRLDEDGINPESCSVVVDDEIYNWGTSCDKTSVVNLLWDLERAKVKILMSSIYEEAES